MNRKRVCKERILQIISVTTQVANFVQGEPLQARLKGSAGSEGGGRINTRSNAHGVVWEPTCGIGGAGIFYYEGGEAVLDLGKAWLKGTGSIRT